MESLLLQHVNLFLLSSYNSLWYWNLICIVYSWDECMVQVGYFLLLSGNNVHILFPELEYRYEKFEEARTQIHIWWVRAWTSSNIESRWYSAGGWLKDVVLWNGNRTQICKMKSNENLLLRFSWGCFCDLWDTEFVLLEQNDISSLGEETDPSSTWYLFIARDCFAGTIRRFVYLALIYSMYF